MRLRALLVLLTLLAATAQAGPALQPSQLAPLLPAPEETAEDVLARARSLLAADQIPAAADTLRGALTVWPDDHDLLVLAGWTAVWSDDAAQARIDFERALALAPESLDALDGLAVALAYDGKRPLARQALARANALDDDERSREERTLRVRWASGDQAGSHILAARIARTWGESDVTDAVSTTPWGFEARGHLRVALRTRAPLARFGGLLRVAPHELLRFWVRWEGSTWLGDREFTFGGGAQLLTPAGFSLVVHGGGGVPGVRESQGEVGVGLGWRIRRIFEVEAGWTLRRWASGTVLHLLRAGVALDFPRGTRIGGAAYLGLVAPHLDPRPRPAPGIHVSVRQPLWDPVTLVASYALGTEVIVDPFTRAERTLLTHRIPVGVDVQATARFGFRVGYAMEIWTGDPPFHGMELEVRTLW